MGLCRSQSSRVAGNEGGPTRVHPDVPWLDIRIGVHDRDDLERYPELLRHDHRERGLRALTELGRAGDQRHPAGVVELDHRATAIGAVDPRASTNVHERSGTEAAVNVALAFPAARPNPNARAPARGTRAGHTR